MTRVLLASNDRHFSIARGKGAISVYGAKAFASVPEFADARGVRVSLSPTQELLPMLTDASWRERVRTTFNRSYFASGWSTVSVYTMRNLIRKPLFLRCERRCALGLHPFAIVRIYENPCGAH